MKSLRTTALVAPLLYILALGGMAVRAGGQPPAGPRMALASSAAPRSAQLTPVSAPSCPLSLAQQVKSVRAFAEMMPVFRHPRCTNCHGGVNPFVEPEIGGHRAGAMEPPPPINTEQCQDCHDQLPGWDIPGTPLFFTGKSDEEICMQVKAFAETGHGFIEHIRHDHGGIQFIAAGFKGDRALDKQSLADHDVVIAKPPGDQPGLTKLAEKWVKAMGGEFAGSLECGCVKPKIELSMASKWKGTDGAQIVTAEVKATVELTADSSGLVYTGKAPLQHGRYTAPNAGCAQVMSPSGGVLDVKEARFDIADDQRMTISLAVEPTNSGGTMTYKCPRMGPVTIPIMPWAGEWKFVHQPDLIGRDYHFDEFDAASGTAFGGERTLVGHKEVSRTVERDGLTLTSSTTFEFWSQLKAK